MLSLSLGLRITQSNLKWDVQRLRHGLDICSLAKHIHAVTQMICVYTEQIFKSHYWMGLYGLEYS